MTEVLGLTPGDKIRNKETSNIGEYVSTTRSTVMIRFGDRMTVYVPVAMFCDIYEKVEEEP